MLTSEEIKVIVSNGEGFNAEFKAQVPQKVRELSEEVCAFANAAGGYLLIGVDDKNNIVGVNIDNTNFQQCDRIFFDEVPCPDFDYKTQVDLDTFEEFRLKSHISPEIPHEQILGNLQVFDKDNTMKRGGVLFFGKRPEDHFYQAITRCVRFKGTTKVHIIDDKTYGGSVLQQYTQARKWVQDKMEVAYIMEGMGARKEIWEIPLEVFKESIINAICHRDYYEKGANIMIEVYDDRVEISNPGGLLPVVADSFGKKSMSRNPLIFGLFTRMHLVEKVGSGIPRMRDLMLEAGLPEPVYETSGFFSVTFLRPKKETVTTKQNRIELTDVQKTILKMMEENNKITFNEMMKKLILSRDTLNRAINQLKENNLIAREGSKKAGIWIVY